jgi:soluble lytic murein transglycosylase
MSPTRLAILTLTVCLAMADVADGQPSSRYEPPSPYDPPPRLMGYGQTLSQSDAQALRMTLEASASGNGAAIRTAMAGVSDPLARKIALWALADNAPSSLSDEEARSLATLPLGWPRTDRGQIAAQRQQLVNALDAEFQSGWTALIRLHNPSIADQHFARIQAMSQTPLTQSRALYWRGRTAEAMGEASVAELFYAQAARYTTTFYGQLAAAKAAAPVIVLGHDPEITATDRSEFESLEPVRAARLLAQIGAKNSFETFVKALSDTLPSASQEALLVDLAQGQGDQTLAMRVVRNAARRGFILPERGYPIRPTPRRYDAPEAAFVLGIVRQESSFDPMAHSGAGARGMMQLMPATARGVASRLGLDEGDLYDATYNMTLGSAFLGQLVDRFDGSYVMAAAGYNAGPNRPGQWAADCGDPRTTTSDAVNFIECIPLDETRDYVMRVLEATQVYRARLNGGMAPITLADDLKRGGHPYGAASVNRPPPTAWTGGASAPSYSRSAGPAEPRDTMAPIPNP